MKVNVIFELPDAVKKILNKLTGAGYPSYVVGGCVRDQFMGRTPNDWDVTTSARPDEMKRVLGEWKLLDTGLKHGTITVLLDQSMVEVTTFRVDGAYTDNRHPDEVFFTTKLEDDLARRDFTINALAYHPDSGVIDCFGGVEDLNRKLIRCVGEPDRRFQEDGLRILRALRFASILGFSIEKQTSDSIFRNASLLNGIANERIREEFTKLLCGNDAVTVLRKYQPVIGCFLPELNAMIQFPQRNPYHCYDVWEHTLNALEHTADNPVLRMAVLLHDSGKPACHTRDENGIDHFHGHGEKSREIAHKVLRRLRFDNNTIRQIEILVEAHDIALPADRKILLHRLNRFGETNLSLLFQIKEADIQAQNPDYWSRLNELNEAKKLLEQILFQKLCFRLKDLAINGSDLIKLGILPGPNIGRILNRLLDEVLDGTCENQRGALMRRAEEIRTEK